MSYRQLYDSGRLKDIAQELRRDLSCCRLCPRRCGVNRNRRETGYCRTRDKAIVSSSFLHFDEEPEIVGKKGSGTIFFSFCNLGCIYCQNYELSHLGEGVETDSATLAQMMLKLQAKGAENINLVTPTHVLAQVIEALAIAAGRGLNIPLVYNCGGYEDLSVLKLVEGIFDIYMPDLKYSDDQNALTLSQAADYWQVSRAAVKEMHRQVGDLKVEGGVARSGLLIRHLVLPNSLAGSEAILDFIVAELGAATFVNIMDQYRPCFNAKDNPKLSRIITSQEYTSVIEYARSKGLRPCANER